MLNPEWCEREETAGRGSGLFGVYHSRAQEIILLVWTVSEVEEATSQTSSVANKEVFNIRLQIPSWKSFETGERNLSLKSPDTVELELRSLTVRYVFTFIPLVNEVAGR